MYIYYIIPLLFFFFFATSQSFKSFLGISNNVFYILCCFFVLSVIISCKNISVGADTAQYYAHYSNIRYIQYKDIFLYKEFMFYFIIKFLSDLSISFYGFMVLYSALLSFAFIYFSKHFVKGSTFLLPFFFFFSDLFTMAMSGIRQMLAVSALLIALVFLFKKKYIYYLLIICIAFFIHKSVIVFLPLVFYNHLKITKRFIIVLSCFLPVAFLLYPVVSHIGNYFSYYDGYLTPGKNYHLNMLIIFIYMLLYLFVVIKMLSTTIDNIDSYLFIFVFLSCLFIFIGYQNIMIARFTFYTDFPMLVLIINVINRLKKNDKLFFTSMILLFLAIKFYYSTPGGTLQIDNYKFFDIF